jgi:aryl-alcohol dehydrogenase-like predicted oxidoreductase
MEYGTIQGVNKPVSRFVLGTMVITDEIEARPKGAWGDYGRQESFELLDAVFAQGGNTFDTAHVYGIDGASERGLGLWIKERGNREEVVIIGKGAIRKSPPAPFRVTPESIDQDIYESLKRMQADYMDAYMLHYDAPNAPIGPLVETLFKHLEAGRIHAYGGSNTTHQRIEEANEYAAKHKLAPFAISEPNYSLAEQVVPAHGAGCVALGGAKNRGARAWYAKTQIPVVPYSSLGGGFFSGRITREHLAPGGFEQVKDQLQSWCVKGYCHEVNFRRLERAWILAEEKGVPLPQIALAFILQSPLNVFPLIGARTREEFAENVKALDVKLTEQERTWLDLETDER